MSVNYNKLLKHKDIWKRKAILKEIYGDWYKLILENIIEGKIVEIGSGPGNFSNYHPKAISSDIIYCPWLNLVFDATKMPFRNKCIENFVMVDVLHHLNNIFQFFNEIVRTLKNKGRLLLLEPYISPFSYPIYKYIHREPVILNESILLDHDSKYKFISVNQAILKIIFWKEAKKFRETYPQLRVIKKSLMGLFLYPLSGGFEYPTLIPSWSVGIAKFIERLLKPFAKLLAFRSLVVIEKNSF
ncbi:MAG: methyltransferase domain-containing protein [Deltaproteobacteria bacterium]|nr:MAG: methyltransferase domain-containing protein [Deltaproteobacteria bacterium]